MFQNRSMDKARGFVVQTRERSHELWFRIAEKLGLIPEVQSSNLSSLDSGLHTILFRTVSKESISTDLPPWTRGSRLQRDRIREVADLCARRYPGDFLEIGAYIGETTIRLAEVARMHHRRVVVVDPWEPGTQNNEGWEYEAFLKNIESYSDVVDIVRASSLDRNTKALIDDRDLSFAFVDGLHTYHACLSDISAVAHTHGLIAVDDIRWSDEILRAFRRGAFLTRRIPVHHPLCREGYLLSQS